MLEHPLPHTHSSPSRPLPRRLKDSQVRAADPTLGREGRGEGGAENNLQFGGAGVHCETGTGAGADRRMRDAGSHAQGSGGGGGGRPRRGEYGPAAPAPAAPAPASMQLRPWPNTETTETHCGPL